MCEHVVAEDVCREDLAEGWRLVVLLATRQALLLSQCANRRVLVSRPCARLQHVCEQCPDGLGPVCASPAANTCIPHHGVQLLRSMKQLLCQSFHRRELREIHQHTFNLNPLLQQQADAHGPAIGLPQRVLQVCVEPRSRVLALASIAGGVEDVEGLGLRAREEELVDEAAADCEAEAAV